MIKISLRYVFNSTEELIPLAQTNNGPQNLAKYCPRALLVLGMVVHMVTFAPVQAQPDRPLDSRDLVPQSQPQIEPQAQARHRQKQLNFIQPQRYDLNRYPVHERNETHWRQTLWATALLEPPHPQVRKAIAAILTLSHQADLEASQQRIVTQTLQVANQLFLENPAGRTEIGESLQGVAAKSPVADWVAIALTALVQGGLPQTQFQTYQASIQNRFDLSRQPSLEIALRDIQEHYQPTPSPPLEDLLSWQIAQGQSQLYVLCRRERGTLCPAILKDQQGQWMRDLSQPHQPLWSVELLSRSLHGLRWHSIRGATPQGIYRLEGAMPRPQPAFFPAYGQFPLVKVFLPFEAGVRHFFPQQPPTLTYYQTLLPPSWRNYFPIQQSYWAGALGRSLIRIHGSGEFPSFFVNNERFPQSWGWNPAIGCLSAQEQYNSRGELQKADMPAILNALSQAQDGFLSGYVIVAEVPGAGQDSISLEEIKALLN